MRLVGLTGRAQAGKDTSAEPFVNAGWLKLAFADPIRDGLYALNPWVKTPEGFLRLAELLVDNTVDNWDRAKQLPEVRELMQRFGSEFGRDVLGSDVWVNHMEERLNEAYRSGVQGVVITDVRLPDEAELVREFDGVMVRVVRPGYEPVKNGHRTESAEIKCDAELVNDSTVARLQHVVRARFGI